MFASVFSPISLSAFVFVCICVFAPISMSVFVFVCISKFASVFAPISLSVKPALRLPRPEMTDRVGCSAGDRGRERKTFLQRNSI